VHYAYAAFLVLYDSQNKHIISVTNIKQLVFVTEKRIFFEIGTKFVNV
jgi:hypothetical protein